MKKVNSDKNYIPFEEEIPKNTGVSKEEPTEVKTDGDKGYGYIYPQELERFGSKGLDFYNYILNQDDGPVDEYVVTARAFKYVASDKTPDGSILYTIKDPVKNQEIEMATNVYEIAIKKLKEEGGKLPTNEPVRKYENRNVKG